MSYRVAMAEADQALRVIGSRAEASAANFDPAMVSGLPEIGRRYFHHAIAAGTPLLTTVDLNMRGRFLLGNKGKYQGYAMTARQILRPPFEFVWMPDLRCGPIRISGSDALVQRIAWTRFWMWGLIPVADQRSSPDMIRSAAFRASMEGVWVPASLLPARGVQWEETGQDTARLRIPSVNIEIVLDLTFATNGAIRQLIGQRWSNANPESVFRLQPFGGTVQEERTFEGYTIPGKLQAGNLFGTDDYLPFFQAEIVRAHYLGVSP